MTEEQVEVKASTKKRKSDGAISNRNSNNNTDVSGSSSNKKRALKHARQSHRPHSESVIAAKELWNKLRVKTISVEERTIMIETLMNLLEGKFYRVAMQHDASRVVQAVIQFGDQKQRYVVVKELCASEKSDVRKGEDKSANGGTKEGNLAELCKVQYAHFVVLKMIKYCAKEVESSKIIAKAFKGHISKLAVHAVGARVVELLFSTFPAKTTAMLKLEMYGPQFALFSSGEWSNNKNTKAKGKVSQNHPTLATVMGNSISKSQREAAIEHLLSLLQKGMDKGLFGFAYFQQLFEEYVTCASPNQIRAITPSMSDHSIHLLSTRSGARVVAECVAYGTSKDRKRIMKSLKGFASKILLESDFAYIALLQIINLTDDTVTVQKSILSELLTPQEQNDDTDTDKQKDKHNKDMNSSMQPSTIPNLLLSETASKLFLLLLTKTDEDRNKYFDPMELEILKSNPTILEEGQEVPTSRKNSNTRRIELLQYLQKSLINTCMAHTKDLICSRSASRVFKEVYSNFPQHRHQLIQVIATCFQPSTPIKDTHQQSTHHSNTIKTSPLFEHPVAHLLLKNIILAESAEIAQNNLQSTGHSDSSETASLASEIYSLYKGSLLNSIASSNRGAFVLVAMAMAPNVDEDVKKELQMDKQIITTKASSIAGFEALLKCL